MKLITAIVSKEDARAVNHALVDAGFSVTRLSTTGGFLMASNITLLIGTEDDKVEDCIRTISQHSRQRTEMVPGGVEYVSLGAPGPAPLKVTVGGATVFVTPVERFEKL